MVRNYELLYIVRPDVDDQGLKQAIDSIDQLIANLDGEVQRTTSWGKRHLAYEVQHLRDGFYVLTYCRLDGGRVRELESALRIHDTVFRHLLTVRDPNAEIPPPEAPRGEEETVGELTESNAIQDEPSEELVAVAAEEEVGEEA